MIFRWLAMPRDKPFSLKTTLNRLFDLFDTDGNGKVDMKEMAAGLSLLCGVYACSTYFYIFMSIYIYLYIHI